MSPNPNLAPHLHLVPASSAGRVPPHNLDAEAAVLSAVLLSRPMLDRVIDLLKREHFYSDANGWIWEAAQTLAQAGGPVDVITVADWLRARERMGVVGGASYLAQLTDATPFVAHIEAHARVVLNKWRLRQIIATCQTIAAEGYGDVGEDVDAWLTSAEGSILACTESGAEDSYTPTMREALAEVFAALQNPDTDPGVRTGLVDLDALMGPLRGGQMIVIGAHTGIGKTSLAMHIGINVALKPQCLDGSDVWQGVLVFSHEMTRHELAERALFARAQVNSSKVVHRSRITPDDWRSLTAAAPSVALPNVWIDDRSGLSPEQIRSAARRVRAAASKQGFPLRLIIVDYLQLIDGTTGGKHSQERREREIAFASVQLKTLAKELGIPVIVLAQLNDDARREKRPPRKEDLRECKAVAHDADKVILIHNASAVERANARRRGDEVHEALPAEVVDLIVDKNRGGPTGKVAVLFFPSYTLFGNAAEEHHALAGAAE